MSSGNDPVGLIITKLAEIEAALTPPTGAEKQPQVYDEAPVTPGVFPCFINVPREGVYVTGTGSLRETKEIIDVMLLFGVAETRYSQRAQRLWVPVFLDAFDAAIKLNDNVVQLAEITGWNYDPVLINEVPYIAVTFVFECHLSGATTFNG